MLKKFLTVLLVFFLAGCAEQPDPVVSTCPAIRNFNAVQEAAQADAIAALPPESPLISPLKEWASLRAQLKPCQIK